MRTIPCLLSVVLVLFMGVVAIGQSGTYKSSAALIEILDTKTEMIDRTISINDSIIKITKYLNGSKEDYVLRIEKTATKDFNFDQGCKWYYCKSVKKDPINGYTKCIVIVGPTWQHQIDLFDFADEVTVFHTHFMID